MIMPAKFLELRFQSFSHDFCSLLKTQLFWPLERAISNAFASYKLDKRLPPLSLNHSLCLSLSLSCWIIESLMLSSICCFFISICFSCFKFDYILLLFVGELPRNLCYNYSYYCFDLSKVQQTRMHLKIEDLLSMSRSHDLFANSNNINKNIYINSERKTRNTFGP